MWVKALLCALQVGTRPLLDKGRGQGTCQSEGQAKKPESINDEVSSAAVRGWQLRLHVTCLRVRLIG